MIRLLIMISLACVSTMAMAAPTVRTAVEYPRSSVVASDARVIPDLSYKSSNARPIDTEMLGRSLVFPLLNPAQTRQLRQVDLAILPKAAIVTFDVRSSDSQRLG